MKIMTRTSAFNFMYKAIFVATGITMMASVAMAFGAERALYTARLRASSRPSYDCSLTDLATYWFVNTTAYVNFKVLQWGDNACPSGVISAFRSVVSKVNISDIARVSSAPVGIIEGSGAIGTRCTNTRSFTGDTCAPAQYSFINTGTVPLSQDALNKLKSVVAYFESVRSGSIVTGAIIVGVVVGSIALVALFVGIKIYCQKEAQRDAASNIQSAAVFNANTTAITTITAPSSQIENPLQRI